MERGVTVGAHATIGAGATLLKGCDIRAGAHVGRECDVGRDAVVLDHARLEDGASVDDRATVQPARRVADGERVRRNEERAHAYGTRAAEGWPKVAATARIHPTARVDPSATVCDGARIGPNTTVGPDCTVGERATLSAATLGAGARVGDDAAVIDSTSETGAEVAAKTWVESAYVCQRACVGDDGRDREAATGRTAVIGDGSETLQKKNGTAVPPTPDEAGIIVGAEARVSGPRLIEGSGTIGDGDNIELRGVASNALGGRATTAAGTEATRRVEHGLSYCPAEGPGGEANCTPRAWRSFQHLEDVPLDTAPEAPAQPHAAAGAASRTHDHEREHHEHAAR